jgi:hypothetical protein
MDALSGISDHQKNEPNNLWFDMYGTVRREVIVKHPVHPYNPITVPTRKRKKKKSP